jgi:hypothetical protein
MRASGLLRASMLVLMLRGLAKRREGPCRTTDAVTTLAPTGAVRAALERLIDYAGLFPPANLPMDGALTEYEQAREGAASWMLSRFIVKATDLDALRARLAADTRVELTVIASPAAFEAVAAARRDDWATVASLEVPLGEGAIDDCSRLLRAARLDDLPTYVELARNRLAMPELAQRGLGAKLRCGGVEPSAFPSVEEVAAFIYEAVAAGAPFKATAGLHHPVRHFNTEAGVMMHGFLNILIAAAKADKVDRAGLEAIVSEQDPVALWVTDEDLVRRGRARFVSYGSCSFDEPVADLRALGLLPPK